MTYPTHIRKKILTKLENSTYREVAAGHRIGPNPLATCHNPKAAAVLRPAFSQKKSSGKTWPSTLMTINGKGLLANRHLQGAQTLSLHR